MDLRRFITSFIGALLGLLIVYFWFSYKMDQITHSIHIKADKINENMDKYIEKLNRY